MVTHALLTDLYELTMAAGYLEQGKADELAAFNLYYRHNPFKGGYAVAAGLEDAIRALVDMRFNQDDLDFLRSLKTSTGLPLFSEQFLHYLASFQFRGNVQAIAEGTVVFPNEPLLQVSGKLIECQMAETILLCHVNFQTLVATKAARLWEASNHGTIIEFGLRRAQGPDGALSACRAALIGGADATSNVLAAALLSVPAKGTQAHSWIQSFPSELDAFRSYARSFPDECVLLVDTYDVLRSGVPNAIQVAKELEQQGHRLAGLRIDSGDLFSLSRCARQMLDKEGLDYVKIIASSDLDEYLISDIVTRGGEIDVWGVGTNLVTGAGEGGCALGGVYKMVEHNGQPRIKLSNDPEKMTNPGIKKVFRFYDKEGLMETDVLTEGSEDLNVQEVMVVDPNNPSRAQKLDPAAKKAELLQQIMRAGEVVYSFPSLEQMRTKRKEQLAHLPECYRRLINPDTYQVGITLALKQQKERMLRKKIRDSKFEIVN